MSNEHLPFIPVAYPDPDFRIRSRGGKQEIWDRVRRKYIALTPEEWVRQNFLCYLISAMAYPAPLIAVEKEIRLGSLRKRCDIVVYHDSAPWLVVECKEPNVAVSESVLRQALAYNLSLDVPYLVLTNGAQTCAIGRGEGEPAFLSSLPPYGEGYRTS